MEKLIGRFLPRCRRVLQLERVGQKYRDFPPLKYLWWILLQAYSKPVHGWSYCPAEFAILTDIIYKAWAGKNAKEYKQFKGLKKENLRDNMTNRELVLNMLAEVSTKDISEAENPDTFVKHAQVAKRGGNVAKTAREQLEKELGHSVISPENAKTLGIAGNMELPFKDEESK